MTTDFQTFEVRRTVKARPETVYGLWTDPARKEAWFCWDANGWTHEDYSADLTEGGHEKVRFAKDGVGSFGYAAHLFHLRPETRLVYGYTMEGQSGPISVSQATVTFAPTAEGTEVVYTEQVVFLDGQDSLETRVQGCEDVLDRLKEAAEERADA